MANDEPQLAIWVVYDHPRDWPNYFVARQWLGETATGNMILHTDLEQLRDMLEGLGLVHLDRMEGDDPVILETWL
jgi:hypothetical protein